MKKSFLFLIVFVFLQSCYPTKPNPYLHDNSNVVASMKGLYIKNPYFLNDNIKLESINTFDFTIKNRTDSPITLESIKSSCKCTKVSNDTVPIKPGETRHIIAKFHADYEGEFHHTIYIKTSLSENYVGLIIQGKVAK